MFISLSISERNVKTLLFDIKVLRKSTMLGVTILHRTANFCLSFLAKIKLLEIFVWCTTL